MGWVMATPQMIKQMYGKGKGGGGKGKKNIGMVRRTGKSNPERVAWIGGLEGKKIDKEVNKKLKAHIEKLVGEGVKFVDINDKGQGGAIFASAEQAEEAISTVNGTKFMGKKLTVDVWASG